MNFVRSVFSRNRLRAAKRRVAEQPSPTRYAELAREYARLGSTRDVRRTCVEGLALFPGNAGLQEYYDGALRRERESRLSELKHELELAPRPAVWRETVEILLESSRPERAEDVVLDWQRACDDDDAAMWLARVRVERFFADRGRELGKGAFQSVDAFLERRPRDPRGWRLKARLATRIGAWDEARKCVAQVLRLEPGDPSLEARYRTLDALSDGSTPIEQALLGVERTGRFADEGEDDAGDGQADAGPVLMRLVSEPSVAAAVYVRGSTALVQGPHGATAERTARAVRSVLTSGRATARRLGLGRLYHVGVEGPFGAIAVSPGEIDAGAVISRGPLTREGEALLEELAGLNARVGGNPA